MALPHTPITPIPNNEPDAVPSLWNTRYEQIDTNFGTLDDRLSARESEISTARGGKASLGDRIQDIDNRVGTEDPQYQNVLHYFVRDLMERAALNTKESEKTRAYRYQSGVIELVNRGVVNGLSISKSTNAARNLNLAAGRLFMAGRIYTLQERLNAAAVPPNPGTTAQTCTVYLRQSAGAPDGIEFGVSMLGVDAPADALVLYRVTVPAGNTSSVDPSLDAVALTDVRRMEPSFPALLDSPATVLVALPFALPNTNYQLDIDAVSAIGAPLPSHAVVATARASNGFRVTLASAADSVRLRWSVTLMEI